MTPKQKKLREQNLKMIEFLGLPKHFKSYSDVHLRKVIEARKAKVLDDLGVKESEITSFGIGGLHGNT